MAHGPAGVNRKPPALQREGAGGQMLRRGRTGCGRGCGVWRAGRRGSRTAVARNRRSCSVAWCGRSLVVDDNSFGDDFWFRLDAAGGDNQELVFFETSSGRFPFGVACTRRRTGRNLACLIFRDKTQDELWVIAPVAGRAGRGNAQAAAALCPFPAGRAGVDVDFSVPHLGMRSVLLGDTQLMRQCPELRSVVAVRDVGDFMPERVQSLRQAMLHMGLPAHDNPVFAGLVIAAISLAGGDDNLWRRQTAAEMRGIESVELGAEQPI